MSNIGVFLVLHSALSFELPEFGSCDSVSCVASFYAGSQQSPSDYSHVLPRDSLHCPELCHYGNENGGWSQNSACEEFACLRSASRFVHFSSQPISLSVPAMTLHEGRPDAASVHRARGYREADQLFRSGLHQMMCRPNTQVIGETLEHCSATILKNKSEGFNRTQWKT